MDGNFIPSLGSLFQYLITFSVIKIFLISSLNLPCPCLGSHNLMKATNSPILFVIIRFFTTSAFGTLLWVYQQQQQILPSDFSLFSQAKHRCLHCENRQDTPALCLAPWLSHPMATKLFQTPLVKNVSKEGLTNQEHWLNSPTLQQFLWIYQTPLKPATHC